MAASFAVDTNCMVSAVSAWHAQHAAATAEITRRLDGGERMLIPAHALSEAFSVLSRFPAPHRLGPADAWELLHVSFVTAGQVVTLSARAHVGVIAALASTGTGGGRVHDAIIAEAAVKAGATTLLTFNVKHFAPFSDRLTIAAPE